MLRRATLFFIWHTDILIMKEKRVKAFLIRAVDYGESDKILSLYSIEEGKISARIKGVKKANSKLRFAAGSFCFGEYILSCSDKGSTVINCTPIELFAPLYDDIVKTYAGYTVCEFLDRFCEEGEENANLCVTVLKTLKEIAYGEAETVLIIVWFFINALKLSGYAINFAVCAKCGEHGNVDGFSFRLGSGVCKDCFDDSTKALTPAQSNILRILTKSDTDILKNMKFESKDVNDSLRLIKQYVEYLYSKKADAFEQFIKIIG